MIFLMASVISNLSSGKDNLFRSLSVQLQQLSISQQFAEAAEKIQAISKEVKQIAILIVQDELKSGNNECTKSWHKLLPHSAVAIVSQHSRIISSVFLSF